MSNKPDLQVRWSRRENDVEIEWRSPAKKADMNLLFLYLTSDRPRFGMNACDPSLVKELEDRGYDLATLKFSISKKKQGNDL